MKDFEVIVVGAGPAGAMITKELAKRKISVVCIEKEIGWWQEFNSLTQSKQ